MKNHSASQNIVFKTSDTPIDYFKLEKEHFPGCIFEKKMIIVKEDEYLSDISELTNLSSENNQGNETVLFNFQVGMGKSRLFYKLIGDYSNNKDYLVIICSPYKKLVNKDFEYLLNELSPITGSGAIKGRKKKVYNYLSLGQEKDFWLEEDPGSFYDVHLMTVNCLLGNPGTEAFEQNISKGNYINTLLQRVNDQGKKVVLFIDEIHDSIHNFKNEFLPRLISWKQVVKKVYVSTATYTPSVIPVVSLLSLLTDRKISVFEGDRIKAKKRADINLNILPRSYSFSKNNQLQKLLIQKIHYYHHLGKRVNIITSTKAFAESLHDAHKDLFKLVTSMEGRQTSVEGMRILNLLTGDTDVEFDKNENNIGTAFQTGVDIEDGESVLIVIFPHINEQKNSFNYYNIFSAGTSSIIQTIGRMRNGGLIEMFIYDTTTELGNTMELIDGAIFTEKKIADYFPLNEEFVKVKAKYHQLISPITNEIYEMENVLGISGDADVVLENKNKFGFWYPNFYEFLINSKRAKLLFEEPAFGNGISPYVLWACLNQQFANAELKNIKFYEAQVYICELTTENCEEQFSEIIQLVNTSLSKQKFRDIMDDVQRYFKYYINDVGEKVEIKFKIKGKEDAFSISTFLSRYKDYAKEGGGYIILADSLMVLGSGIIAMLLKQSAMHYTTSLLVLSVYLIPYFTNIRS